MSPMEERIWQPGNIEVELRGVGAHVAQSGEWEFGINTIFLYNLVEQLSQPSAFSSWVKNMYYLPQDLILSCPFQPINMLGRMLVASRLSPSRSQRN